MLFKLDFYTSTGLQARQRRAFVFFRQNLYLLKTTTRTCARTATGICVIIEDKTIHIGTGFPIRLLHTVAAAIKLATVGGIDARVARLSRSTCNKACYAVRQA